MLIKNRSCVYDFEFQLVFTTKDRKPIFTNPTKQTLIKSILMSIGINNNVMINQLTIHKDHVQMIISFKPKHAPASIVKSFKGTSAREWFKQYPATKQQLKNGHLWSANYYMSTIGNISDANLDQYLQTIK